MSVKHFDLLIFFFDHGSSLLIYLDNHFIKISFQNTGLVTITVT